MKVSAVARASIAVLGLVIGGCASVSGFPDRPENVAETIKSLQAKFFLPTTDVLAVYEAKPDGEKRAYRNGVVSGQIRAIDIRFSEFQEALYREGTLSNLSLD